MNLDIEQTLQEFAHSAPVADAAAIRSSLAGRTRHMVRNARRRRTVRHVTYATTSVAAAAATAFGASQAIPALHSLRHPSAAGTSATPGTVLSKRAGVECGKPFDGTGKSDPRFRATDVGADVERGMTPSTFQLSFSSPVFENNQTLTLTLKRSVSPTTAVVLRAGVVVGIAETNDGWNVTHPNEARPTAALALEPEVWLFVPVAETMNCLGIVPTQVTDDMFEVVFLRDYAVAGETGTALVVSAPVRGPHSSAATPQPVNTGDWWMVYPIDSADSSAGDLAFLTADYLRVKNTPGANVPLYFAPTGWVKPGTPPYTGPAEAHATGQGSLVITFNGAVLYTVTDADLSLG